MFRLLRDGIRVSIALIETDSNANAILLVTGLGTPDFGKLLAVVTSDRRGQAQGH